MELETNETQEKKGMFERMTSRREFLKLSGAGIAGTALSFTLINFLTGCATTPTSNVKVWQTASGAIIHDANRCVGCRRCEMICTTVNDGKVSTYISRIKISRNLNFGPRGASAAYWNEAGQLGNARIVGDTCRQCKDPYCGNQCPVQAIYADEETGARKVDEEKCIGCGTCQKACPWQMATVDPETKKSKKCILCDGYPQCEANCPVGAIKFVSWDEAIKLYKSHWDTHSFKV